jgi:hypothetical protein
MVFLDANSVIYWIEQPLVWGPKASKRILALTASGEILAVSDLVRMECLVEPIKKRDAKRIADYSAFFGSTQVRVFPITGSICDKAAEIRAAYGF